MSDDNNGLQIVTLHDLFTGVSHSKVIQIPEYQRNYSWKKNNVWTLLNDMFNDTVGNKIREKSSFGIVIGSIKNKTLSIVDGQQRLGTFQILILVLRYFIKQEYDSSRESLDSDLKTKISNVIGDMYGCLVYKENTPRFSFNYHDKELWENYCKSCDNLTELYHSIKKNKSDKAIDVAFKTIYDELTKEIKDRPNTNEKCQWFLTLWSWISGKNDFDSGVAITVIIEPDPITAIERFDRENNRGVGVGLDDLLRSYLIESITRINNKQEVIDSQSDKVVKGWSIIHNNISSLNKKESFIKWYLSFKSSQVQPHNYSALARNKIVPNFGTNTSDWNPMDVLKELISWSEIYKDLTFYPEETTLNPTQSTLNYFVNCKFQTIWGLLIPLKIRLSEEKMESHKVDDLTGLPVDLISLLEYCIIGRQLFGELSPQVWEKDFRKWRVKLSKDESLTFQLSSIIRELSDSFKQTPEKLANEYNEHWEENGKATLKIAEAKKKVHTRILIQAERSLSEDYSLDFPERGVKSNNLEHILPQSYGPWLEKNKDIFGKKDNSLLSQEELDEAARFKQHLGNHTILHHDWNKKLENSSFYYKKHSPIRFQLKTSPEFKESHLRPSYKNAKAMITKSLMNIPDKFGKNEIMNRGTSLIYGWAKVCGEQVKTSVISNESTDLIIKSEESKLENLLLLSESSTLEKKEGPFLLNLGTQARPLDERVDLDDKKMSLRICKAVNGMLNEEGGTILVGVTDDKIDNLDKVVGIDCHLEAIRKRAKGQTDPEDYLLRVIRERILASIPGDYHQYMPTLKIKKISTGKKILQINVTECEKSRKYVNFLPAGSEGYFTRPGPWNHWNPEYSKDERIDKKGNVIFGKDPIIFASKVDNSSKCTKYIGPFDKKEADKMRTKLYSLDLIVKGPIELSRNPNFIEILDLLMEDKRFFMSEEQLPLDEMYYLIIADVQKSWYLPIEEDYYPNVKNTRCPKCSKHATNYRDVKNLFGFRWTSNKYIVQSYCNDCRRG